MSRCVARELGDFDGHALVSIKTGIGVFSYIHSSLLNLPDVSDVLVILVEQSRRHRVAANVHGFSIRTLYN